MKILKSIKLIKGKNRIHLFKGKGMFVLGIQKTTYQSITNSLRNSKISKSVKLLHIKNENMQLIVERGLVSNQGIENCGF